MATRVSFLPPHILNNRRWTSPSTTILIQYLLRSVAHFLAPPPHGCYSRLYDEVGRGLFWMQLSGREAHYRIWIWTWEWKWKWEWKWVLVRVCGVLSFAHSDTDPTWDVSISEELQLRRITEPQPTQIINDAEPQTKSNLSQPSRYHSGGSHISMWTFSQDNEPSRDSEGSVRSHAAHTSSRLMSQSPPDLRIEPE